jgi:hypothetical protein
VSGAVEQDQTRWSSSEGDLQASCHNVPGGGIQRESAVTPYNNEVRLLALSIGCCIHAGCAGTSTVCRAAAVGCVSWTQSPPDSRPTSSGASVSANTKTPQQLAGFGREGSHACYLPVSRPTSSGAAVFKTLLANHHTVATALHNAAFWPVHSLLPCPVLMALMHACSTSTADQPSFAPWTRRL